MQTFPKVLMEDRLTTLIGSHNSQQGSHRYDISDEIFQALEEKVLLRWTTWGQNGRKTQKHQVTQNHFRPTQI